MRTPTVVLSAVALCLVAGEAVAQEARDASSLVEGRWSATPLVPSQSPVPGADSLLFQQFTGNKRNVQLNKVGLRDPQTYGMTDDGLVVFWAALGGKGVTDERQRLSELQNQYGHATREGRVATARALELEGLRLDPTYTAKTFAAVCDFIGAPRNVGATVLYWHTYDATEKSALAASVDYHELPSALHWVFEDPQTGTDA